MRVFLSNVLLGLKKSFSLLVAIPHWFSIVIIDGFSEINKATAPAPWVYSPDELSSYLDKSEVTTIAFFSGFLDIQSIVFCRASTPPIQAKVISVISQFLKLLSPNFGDKNCSTKSVA